LRNDRALGNRKSDNNNRKKKKKKNVGSKLIPVSGQKIVLRHNAVAPQRREINTVVGLLLDVDTVKRLTQIE